MRSNSPFNAGLSADTAAKKPTENRFNARPPMNVHPFNPEVGPLSYHLPDADSVKPKMSTMVMGDFGKSGTIRQIQWEQDIKNRQTTLGSTIAIDASSAARFRSQFQTRKATKKMKQQVAANNEEIITMSPGPSADDGSPNRDIQSRESGQDKKPIILPKKNIDYDELREEEMMQLGQSTFPSLRRTSTKKHDKDFATTLEKNKIISRSPSTKMLAASPAGEHTEIDGIIGKASSPGGSLIKSPSHELLKKGIASPTSRNSKTFVRRSSNNQDLLNHLDSPEQVGNKSPTEKALSPPQKMGSYLSPNRQDSQKLEGLVGTKIEI